MMNVKLSIPTAVLLEQPMLKVIAAGAHGNFCVLPRHTDYLAALVPGILMLTAEDGQELVFANDHGLLIKRGPDVLISARRAIRGSNLGSLRQTIHDEFEQLTENDRACQTAIAGLEANFLRKFLDMQKELG